LAVAIADALALGAASAQDPSPWARVDAFWLGQPDHAVTFDYRLGEQRLRVRLRPRADGFRIEWPGGAEDAQVVADAPEGELAITLARRRFRARVLRHERQRLVLLDGRRVAIEVIDPYASPAVEDRYGGHLTAPMPGAIVAVHVKPGDRVERGQPLLVMEAMKMEHTIVAPFAGTVEAVYFAAREQVKEGAELVQLTPLAAVASGIIEADAR
ncbi:MAG: acetyl-CoA carboxylase biotin carboxyl carrier protein subunit, partial [Casimicrobiaceae bacterium]